MTKTQVVMTVPTKYPPLNMFHRLLKRLRTKARSRLFPKEAPRQVSQARVARTPKNGLATTTTELISPL